MPLFAPEDLRPGRRVELHPATDEWMSGDRYGAILAIKRGYLSADDEVLVLLDKSQRRVWLVRENIYQVFD